MHKIAIVILILFSLGFYLLHINAIKKIDLNLRNEIGIAFINKDMILVMEKDTSTLLVLGEAEATNVDKFYYRNLNILMINNNNFNIKGAKSMLLQTEATIGNIKYSLQKGLIYINYQGSNTCIYMGGEYNISNCQFIYFYDTNVSHLTLYDYNEIVLYYYKKPLSTIILENIYEQSVDTYQIRDDELTIIKLSEEDYELIVIPND